MNKLLKKQMERKYKEMKITMLGTGHATVTNCYNTCFTISENDKHFLVDAGGGNGILKQLEEHID